MIRGHWALLAIMVLVGFHAQAGADSILGTAADFAVLAGSGITNTGPSVINGDLGVSPGSAITGFPPGIVNGTVYQTDAVALQAQNDLTTAYTNLFGMTVTQDLTGQDLEGMVLLPGVYVFSSSAMLSNNTTGILTLNANNDPNAVFVFLIGSTLTTASYSSVVVINPPYEDFCNKYFVVGSSATIGTYTDFEGTILALTSITLNTGANITRGRALARNGAVTLDTNTITNTYCDSGDSDVPEPGTYLLFGVGLALLLTVRKKLVVAAACRTRSAV